MNSAELILLPFNPKIILFVCTGNLCRSVAAEEILKEMLSKAELDIFVHSAGTSALSGQKASVSTLKFLKNGNCDLNQHRSRQITQIMINEADIIFVMEQAHQQFILSRNPEARDKLFLLTDFHPTSRFIGRESNIPDPIGMSDFFYENVNEMIQLSCLNITSQLRKVCQVRN